MQKTDNKTVLNDSSLRERIAALRKENNLSIGQMAEEANLSRNAYNCLENGSTTILNPILEEIAKAFGMSVDEIIFYDPEAALRSPVAYELEISRLKTNVVALCSIMERIAGSRMDEEELEFLQQTLKKISAEPGGPALKYLRKLELKF